MGQQLCSIHEKVSDSKPKTNTEISLYEDSEVKQQGLQDDLPSAKLDGPAFLNTEVIASWNLLSNPDADILQNLQYLLKSQDSESSSSKKIIFNQKRQRVDSIKELPGEGEVDLENIVKVFSSMKQYKATLKKDYENIEIDVSSFIETRNEKIQKYYDFKEKLGEGTYGSVYRAVNIKSSQIRAIKVLKKHRMSSSEKLSFIAEADLLKKLDHPNIIKLYEIFYFSETYYVVTQLCSGGEVQDLFKKSPNLFTEDVVKVIMKQLVSTMCYLESKDIVHRDLKLQNMVFVKHFDSNTPISEIEVKVIDFGTAIKVKKHAKNKSCLVGTLLYMAPQFLKGFFTQKCDVWSAGVVMYLLLFKKYPFIAMNQKQVMVKIQEGQIQWDVLPKTVSAQAKKLLKGMLEKNYLSRLSCSVINKSEWLRSGRSNNKDSTNDHLQVAKKMTNYQSKNNFLSLIQSYLSFRETTQQERRKLSQMFAQIDQDNSGVLEISELLTFYQQHFPEVDSHSVQKMVSQIDKNKSGKIDFSQFVILMTKNYKEHEENALKEAFDYIDVDKTGFIDMKEFKKTLRGSAAREIQELFSNLDMDNDNRISWEQFKQYIAEH